MIRAMSALAFVGVFLSACQSGPAQNKDKFVVSKDAQQIIDLTNQARAKEKLPPLKANALLFKCAQAHTDHMAKIMKAGHIIDGKTTPADRVDATGYYYKTCGENVAQAPPNSAQIPTIFNGWMNSPIHRREILRGEYEEIGIGIGRDAKGLYYFTQVFGTELKKE
jgi:uncharacterized protein YkwD